MGKSLEPLMTQQPAQAVHMRTKEARKHPKEADHPEKNVDIGAERDGCIELFTCPLPARAVSSHYDSHALVPPQGRCAVTLQASGQPQALFGQKPVSGTVAEGCRRSNKHRTESPGQQ